MKAGADFEQAAHAAVNFGKAGGGLRDAGENLQQCGLSGAVAADQADDFALLNVEGDIAQRPEIVARRGARRVEKATINARVITSRRVR